MDIKCNMQGSMILPMGEVLWDKLYKVCADEIHGGTIVIRTGRDSIMGLSGKLEDNSWTNACTLRVQLLPLGTAVTLKQI